MAACHILQISLVSLACYIATSMALYYNPTALAHRACIARPPHALLCIQTHSSAPEQDMDGRWTCRDKSTVLCYSYIEWNAKLTLNYCIGMIRSLMHFYTWLWHPCGAHMALLCNGWIGMHCLQHVYCTHPSFQIGLTLDLGSVMDQGLVLSFEFLFYLLPTLSHQHQAALA
jgi:hypothetical protein